MAVITLNMRYMLLSGSSFSEDVNPGNGDPDAPSYSRDGGFFDDED